MKQVIDDHNDPTIDHTHPKQSILEDVVAEGDLASSADNFKANEISVGVTFDSMTVDSCQVTNGIKSKQNFIDSMMMMMMMMMMMRTMQCSK